MSSVSPTPVLSGNWRHLVIPHPPRRVRLLPGEIHVWRLDLNVPAAKVYQLNRSLDDGERVRAARLLFDADRSRFISAHGFVRRLLGSYLGLTPEAIRYDHAPRGKPHLRTRLRATEPRLRFNLSSSDDTALLAVAWNREIGVDVEKIRAERDCMGIAERFFSPWEAAALRRLPDQQRVPAFYRCWTRKEAYVKATGEGMFLPLDSFAVPVDQPHMQPVREEPAAVFPSVGEVGQERWTMIDVPEIAGFAAAVVVESGRAHSQHSAAEQRDLVAQFLVVRSPAGQRAQRLRHAEPSR